MINKKAKKIRKIRKDGIVLIAFTKNGARLGQKICELFPENKCIGYTMEKYSHDSKLIPLRENLSEWTARAFEEKEAIIFVSACGIAVRAVAPYIVDKTTDPAVVAVDEQGKFVISLLSGHVGGANELAEHLAKMLDAQPVISTATDINNKFAVDTWATKNCLVIKEKNIAKKISALILNEENIGLATDFLIKGELPNGLFMLSDFFINSDKNNIGIYVSNKSGIFPFKETLHLVPKNIILGIGCRKGTPVEVIEKFVLEVLKRENIDADSIAGVASIDIKQNEEGLLNFCEKLGVNLKVFTSEELAAVRGDFASSDFVKSVTGVDNICERAAVLASGGKLIFPKQKNNFVTLAAALNNNFYVEF